MPVPSAAEVAAVVLRARLTSRGGEATDEEAEEDAVGSWPARGDEIGA